MFRARGSDKERVSSFVSSFECIVRFQILRRSNKFFCEDIVVPAAITGVVSVKMLRGYCCPRILLSLQYLQEIVSVKMLRGYCCPRSIVRIEMLLRYYCSRSVAAQSFQEVFRARGSDKGRVSSFFSSFGGIVRIEMLL